MCKNLAEYDDIEEEISKCIYCRDYNDTWDYNCFCEKCKAKMREQNEKTND